MNAHTHRDPDRPLRWLLVLTLLAWGATCFGLRAETNGALTGRPPGAPELRPSRAAFLLRVAAASLVERDRAGVPAAITAAQAVLESSWGQAPITLAGNNYFGIKCKSWWGGSVVYHVDDDYDAEGRLTESCFRAYDEVAASFRDHSDFLRGGERYARLFALDAADLEGWARGLKACGYATDPAYADKLLGLIDRLGLRVLDCGTGEELADYLLGLLEQAPDALVTADLADLGLPVAQTIPSEYVPRGE